jgi:hypothetical protein
MRRKATLWYTVKLVSIFLDNYHLSLESIAEDKK